MFDCKEQMLSACILKYVERLCLHFEPSSHKRVFIRRFVSLFPTVTWTLEKDEMVWFGRSAIEIIHKIIKGTSTIKYTSDSTLSSWRNRHWFPFLHFPAFQKLQTMDLTGKL